MAINATILVTYTASGALGGADQITNSMSTATNTNAPPPSAAQLQAGNNIILVPTGFTVNVAFIRPPSTSSNGKTAKAVTGDSNTGAWTNDPIIYPVTGLTQFIINSTGSETVEINWS